MTTPQHLQHFISEPPLVSEEQTVADYLRAHPDFFINHPEVLAELSVQHASGGAVSLIERQVTLLREINVQLRRQLKELVHIARENDRINERLFRLSGEFIDAKSLERALTALAESLHNDFQADAISLVLLAPPQIGPDEDIHHIPHLNVRTATRDEPTLAAFRSVMNRGKPVCGALKPLQINFLFGTQATSVNSAALVPLGANAHNPPCLGLLGIGSFDAERFHHTMGTLFLTQLGHLTLRAVQPHLLPIP